MKIVHLSLEDSFGAGRAAIRINQAVCKNGGDSSVYVLNKNEMADSYAIPLKRADRLKVLLYDRINHMLLKKYGNHGYFHVDQFGINLMKYPEIAEADILHFHWVNEGIWSQNFVRALAESGKPIVWTMHDMWTFTGGCHYDDFCGKYKNQCAACKVLGSTRKKDAAEKAQRKKKEVLSKLNIQLVGCSQWIADQANESMIGGSLHRKAVCIPNPTNENIFKIYDKVMCKNLLEVNPEKKMILFGAVNAASDMRKGAQYLIEALKRLEPEKYVLGVFGSKEVDLGIHNFEIVNFGRISDDFHLALIYNAADVFVAPSMQENLANTVMESLTCGTPVVAFDIGGMPDMVLHGVNGYLAKAFEIPDLEKGIKTAVCFSEKREEIRQTVIDRFSERKVGTAYLNLYNEILNKKGM